MAVFDTFSKRKRRREGKVPDVLSGEVPQPLREQLWHIANEFSEMEYIVLGDSSRSPMDLLGELQQALVREFGRQALMPQSVRANHVERVVDLLMFIRWASAPDGELVDLVELLCSLFEDCGGVHLVEEINGRFREAGSGYEFRDGQVVEVTSQHLHTEAVQPALEILADEAFAGANAEYRDAHGHYRAGRYGDALHECAKAFESTMKVICDLKGRTYSATATAKDLIPVLLGNGLLPPFMQAKLNNFRSLLETAVPTPRNKLDGHGAGANPHDVPRWMAKYLLHLTATTIVMLVDAAEAG